MDFLNSFGFVFKWDSSSTSDINKSAEAVGNMSTQLDKFNMAGTELNQSIELLEKMKNVTLDVGSRIAKTMLEVAERTEDTITQLNFFSGNGIRAFQQIRDATEDLPYTFDKVSQAVTTGLGKGIDVLKSFGQETAKMPEGVSNAKRTLLQSVSNMAVTVGADMNNLMGHTLQAVTSGEMRWLEYYLGSMRTQQLELMGGLQGDINSRVEQIVRWFSEAEGVAKKKAETLSSIFIGFKEFTDDIIRATMGSFSKNGLYVAITNSLSAIYEKFKNFFITTDEAKKRMEALGNVIGSAFIPFIKIIATVMEKVLELSMALTDFVTKHQRLAKNLITAFLSLVTVLTIGLSVRSMGLMLGKFSAFLGIANGMKGFFTFALGGFAKLAGIFMKMSWQILILIGAFKALEWLFKNNLFGVGDMGKGLVNMGKGAMNFVQALGEGVTSMFKSGGKFTAVETGVWNQLPPGLKTFVFGFSEFIYKVVSFLEQMARDLAQMLITLDRTYRYFTGKTTREEDIEIAREQVADGAFRQVLGMKGNLRNNQATPASADYAGNVIKLHPDTIQKLASVVINGATYQIITADKNMAFNNGQVSSVNGDSGIRVE